jgi:hypothetical protein
MTVDKRHCKVCHEEIHGRRDKQYCSDYCRASNFNNFNTDINSLIRRTNYTIRRNRNILAHYTAEGERRIARRALLDSGFNFSYFTSAHTNRTGQTCYFCYDHGYVDEDGEYFLLITTEDQHCGTRRLRRPSHMRGE